jgi:hypothetical protein
MIARISHVLTGAKPRLLWQMTAWLCLISLAEARQPEMVPAPPSNGMSSATPGMSESPYYGDGSLPPAFDSMENEGAGCACSDGCAEISSSGKWFNDGVWYVNLEGTYVGRIGPQKQTILAVDGQSSATAPRRLATDTSQGFAPGMRITLGTYASERNSRNNQDSLEFAFNGLYTWETTKSLANPNPVSPQILTINGTGGAANTQTTNVVDTNTGFIAISQTVDNTQFIPGFTSVTRQTVDYRQTFNDYEITYRIARRLSRDRLVLSKDGTWVRTAQPALLPTFLIGPRLIAANETLTWVGTRSPVTTTTGYNAPATPITQSFGAANGFYGVDTHNLLLGWQMGTEIVYQQPEWKLGVRLRGGPYVNFGDQSQRYNGSDTSALASNNITGPLVTTTINHPLEKRTRDFASFVGDIGLFGAWQLRPNFALKAQYDLLWVSNVAAAPTQIHFDMGNTPRLATGTGLFLQGLGTGFEWTW